MDLIDMLLKKSENAVDIPIFAEKKKRFYSMIQSEEKQDSKDQEYQKMIDAVFNIKYISHPRTCNDIDLYILQNFNKVLVPSNISKHMICLFDNNSVLNIIVYDKHSLIAHISSLFHQMPHIITPTDCGISKPLMHCSFSSPTEIVLYTLHTYQKDKILLSQYYYNCDPTLLQRGLILFHQEIFLEYSFALMAIYNRQFHTNYTLNNCVHINFRHHIFIAQHKHHISVYRIINREFKVFMQINEANKIADACVYNAFTAIYVIVQYTNHRVEVFIGSERYTIFEPCISKINPHLKLLLIPEIKLVMYSTDAGSYCAYGIESINKYNNIVAYDGLGDKNITLIYPPLSIFHSFDDIIRVHNNFNSAAIE